MRPSGFQKSLRTRKQKVNEQRQQVIEGIIIGFGSGILLFIVTAGFRWWRHRPRLTVILEDPQTNTVGSEYKVVVKNGPIPVLLRHIGLRVRETGTVVYKKIIRLPNARENYHLLDSFREYADGFLLPQSLHRLHELEPRLRGNVVDLQGFVEYGNSKVRASNPIRVTVPK
jgi:hypothetical protein